ncbi:MAG: UDP-N-acetylmuramate:L-alanyl-gamma-D-glutamyl-meso-diaminopimelate ligase [Verrucomicrobiales bacterium]|nr:UDP-N-acetylmuramate:L-alanyl-gamma-D-glutamyl-meso-diaminopimelate ligase [Verrucomicrobiales bacterium]
MASTAAALQERGHTITGSDENAYPPMSDFLASRGIPIRTPYAASNLDPAPDLVVIGNAISRGNPEAEAALARRLRFCSLPELLREFFIRGRRSLVVAGTHGKTTTTSLLAWVFESAGLNPSYLIGGIPLNFGAGARFSDSEWFIIEGDEYDTAFFDKRSKFVHYLPEVAILNNLEFDHADIFDDLAAVQRTFTHLIRIVPGNGLLLANGDDDNLRKLINVSFCPVRRFGFGGDSDFRAENVALSGAHSEFDLGGTRFRLPMTGRHNVANALAVAACARHCGLSDTQIQAGFDTFKGIRRRLEVRGQAGGITVIDDFAHHPTAIRETLAALRVRFPESRLWAVFEPRSNTTRRNVLQNELTAALGLADCAVIAAVARANLLPPDQRLDVDRVVEELTRAGRRAWHLAGADEIVELIAPQAKPGDVVAVLSNGGFGGIHDKLLQRFQA